MNSQERDLDRDIERPLENAVNAVEVVREEHAAKPSRRDTVKIALIAAACMSMLGAGISIAVSIAATNEAADVRAHSSALEVSTQQSRDLAQKAYEEAKAANAALLARGQQPVPIPPPDTGNPADTIASAAAAKVLSQLPKQQPTATEIAPLLSQYLADHPQGVSAPQISNMIASYLTNNPLPPGKQGEPGKPGADAPPPTADQILAAITSYCSTRNECQGPTGKPGDTGPQGIGVTITGFALTDGECTMTTVLTNPADNTTTTKPIPVPLALCTPTPQETP